MTSTTFLSLVGFVDVFQEFGLITPPIYSRFHQEQLPRPKQGHPEVLGRHLRVGLVYYIHPSSPAANPFPCYPEKTVVEALPEA